MDSDSTRWLKLRSGSEIRGPEQQLTDERAEKLGYAFACWLAERRGRTPDSLVLAVGRDPRPSSGRIKAALTRGITAADSDVLDCGLCPAPALFKAVQPDCGNADGALMVTASTADPTLNGLRFMTADGGLKGSDVDEILLWARDAEVPERLVARHDADGLYYEGLRGAAARYLEDDALKPLLGMRVVVDARSSVGQGYVHFLDALGVETEGSLHPLEGEAGIADSPDDPQTIDAVVRAVKTVRADMGVLFNADGSRAAIVDGEGRLIAQNRLIALVAAMLLDQAPGATIVTDSVTSSGLSAFIAEWGGIHYRFKRGYRSVIDEAIRLNAEGIDCPLAIETSGHAAFRDNGFVDDGIYLATRVICEALNRKREGQSVFSLIDDLKEPVESVEIRLPVLEAEDPSAASQEVVETLLSYTLDDPSWQIAQDNREGVRIIFNLDGDVNNAWFQLRMSVHDPVMVLNAESDVPGGVKRILGALYALIQDNQSLDLEKLRRAAGKD
ncbi:MAG: phosphomannomutase/phosphoglucomutase [Clostridia bacterium]|nr:phosphomannomutase/phosphoglucomutase [Clostridia bacterium]